MSVKRNWTAAREKVDTEGQCRVCRRTRRQLAERGLSLEAAHILSREADRLAPLSMSWTLGPDRLARGLAFRNHEPAHIWPEPFLVMPTRIVPLCGPATTSDTCHGKDHAGRLDLIPHLTLPEVLQAVHDASRLYGGNGLENARVRLMPSVERAAA